LPVLGLASAAVEEATGGAARLVPGRDLQRALDELIGSQAQRRALSDRCWTAAQTLMRWPQTTAIIARVLQGTGSETGS
jgi:hypothetical protein